MNDVYEIVEYLYSKYRCVPMFGDGDETYLWEFSTHGDDTWAVLRHEDPSDPRGTKQRVTVPIDVEEQGQIGTIEGFIDRESTSGGIIVRGSAALKEFVSFEPVESDKVRIEVYGVAYGGGPPDDAQVMLGRYVWDAKPVKFMLQCAMWCYANNLVHMNNIDG